ncbi:pectinacetylesterase family protein [bacterium]|nr:pectinacetylesterase family protein [bacterium]
MLDHGCGDGRGRAIVAVVCALALFVALAIAGCDESEGTGDDATSPPGQTCGGGKCGSDDENPADDDADDAPDDDSGDDTGDDDNTSGDDDATEEEMWAMFEEAGFLPYLDIRPVRSKEIGNGYTRYYFDERDVRCYNGKPASVAVSPGTSNNVMFFLEGGGASWPGYWLSYALDVAFMNLGYRNRDADNPLADWNFVYVPYCDNSIHVGDAVIEEFGRVVYHQGMRHTAAAAALTKAMFPNPDKVLVTGASAGAFGTYIAYPVVKSQYMDTPIYVFSDSGVGFFDPEAPETWETIKEAWNLRIPAACERCQDGPIQTWLYDLYLRQDPSLRIGLFSSYRDFIISGWFLRMEDERFKSLLLDVSGQIKALHPDRFARFFIDTATHTTYQFLLPGGPNYAVGNTSIYDWIEMLVNDDPAWNDVLE